MLRVGLDRSRFVGPHDHQQIVSARPVLTMVAEGLSKLSLHSVSTNGISDPASDRQTDS